ncbi:MAG: tetratricopeptide repeat protein [Planctomycetes bacterium]|nr:tetratricopeptide repeat protein [Planctomycetota bacterium]
MKKAFTISIALGAGAIIIAAGALWLTKDDKLPSTTATPSPLSPPVPDDLSKYDPALVDVIHQAAQRVRDIPNDSEMRLQLGMVYEANGIYPLAEQTYRQHLDLNPEDARVWYRLAIVYEKVGRLEKSIQAIGHAAEFNNKYAPIQWRLGLWLFDAGRIDEAYNAFARATEIDLEEPAGWYGLARIALARNQPQHAIEIIDAHLLQGNVAPRGYQLLGRAHSLLGNSEKAKAAFAHTTTGKLHWRDPWTTEAMTFQTGVTAKRTLAARYILQRNFQKAIPILEDLIKDKPEELTLLSQLSSAYIEIGQPRRGKAILDEAWQTNRDSFQINYALAKVIVRTPNVSQQELDQALMYVNRAIDSNSSSSLAFTAKAMIQFRRNRPDSSITAFKHAFELDSRRTDQLVNAGFLECNLKLYSDACVTFETAISHSPNLADAYVGSAKALTELGKYDEARSALLRAQELGSANRSRLADALNRLNQLQPTGAPNAPPR